MHSQRQAKTEDKATQLRRSSTLNKTGSTQTLVNHPGAILQQAGASPGSLTHGEILQLQRAIGNRAVGQLIQRRPPEKDKELLQGSFSESVQRQTAEEDEKPLQGGFVDQDNQANLTGMPDHVKTKMETAFNTDFSDVKIHANSSKAPEIGALAFTRGRDIHFASGQYNPGAARGQRLLGHELGHVVQQREGRVQPTGSVGGLPLNDSPLLETEADVMGEKVLQRKAGTEKLNKENKSQSVANEVSQKQSCGTATFQFVDNRPEAIAQRKLQKMADNYSGIHQQPIQKKENTKSGTSGSNVVQLMDFSDGALKAAIKAIEISNLSPTMIAEGYEQILDDDQRTAISNINELRNLLRFKEEFDTRSDARKYTSKALGFINNFDPTNITGGLNKLERALHAMQQAKLMYDAKEEGSAKPLTGSTKSSYGGVE